MRMRNKYRVDKVAEHCKTIKKGKRQIRLYQVKNWPKY